LFGYRNEVIRKMNYDKSVRNKRKLWRNEYEKENYNHQGRWEVTK